MDHEDIVSSLISSVETFLEARLSDKELRIQHKEQCSERLAAENSSPRGVCYSDQAVLANLDWGMDALEEAINTCNEETKRARLEYAEKMLRVCAMLNSTDMTAGVPNFYLSAWAHLNLSYLSKLRNNIHNAVLLLLEMFIVDPFFSRIDFAPHLWKSIFLPHMASIVGWYSDQRRLILMDVVPDTSDLSLTVDLDHLFDESLILSVRPEQTQRIHHLEQLYAQSLDDNTRMYAKYYKDCMGRKVIPMMPIAEPPTSPLRELSGRAVPDYVKFGPILPKSAGFSPRHKDNSRAANGLKAASTSENLEDSATWEVEEEMFEDSADAYVEEDDENISVGSNKSIKHNKDMETISRMPSVDIMINSSHNSSPMDSPTTPCSRNSSPRESKSSGKIQMPMLRLLSARAKDSSQANSVHLDNSSISSADSDGELTERLKNAKRSVHHATSTAREVLPKSSLKEVESCISSPMTPKSRPPKDFVCPITGQIFNDPVTLETGQTYERKAIQEWMNRGNTTCPITRQPLSAHLLPKTNYVLKRLITSWKDQHPDLAHEFSCNETPPPAYSSPQGLTRATGDLSASPISRASVETVINAMKPYILILCSSEDLQQCEAAIVQVSNIWADSKVGAAIHSYLSSPTILNAFFEVLSASLNNDVLSITVHILSQLTCTDNSLIDLLRSIDPDFYCLADLLRKGLSEAAVLLCSLRPSFSQLSSLDLIPTLLHIISERSEEDHQCFQFAVEPKDAALALLEQIVDEGSRNVASVVKENGVTTLLSCLNRIDGRQSVVSILLRCIRVDLTCKTIVAKRIELSPILELFHGGNDNVRGMCVEFLCELVQLRRRTLSNQILQIIKEEGTSSTMHTLLVYLQMSPMEQKPTIAALLLQLDLLIAPRKMSIYREEAIEALIEALERKDFPSSQEVALNTLSSLSMASRKPYMECWLLKIAGFDQPYNTLMRGEQTSNGTEFVETKEEMKAAWAWEKMMAFVLSNHEKGLIFKALEECLKSNSVEIAKSSLVVATWLVHMLYSFPDCGVRIVARKCLLEKFINVLQSSKNLDDKILAAFALRGFVSESGGLNEIAPYAKCIWKTLRRLKKNCKVVPDIMKALMNLPSMDIAELWSCVEGPELDVSMNGEILSMLHIRNRLITGHSDGTIKVWDTGKRAPRIIQEARQHSKAVTCLYVPPSCDKLYSGSLDKTIRVWAIKQEEIHCIQAHDVKEMVLALVANATFACFSSQANGIKVYNWSGVPKSINFNKHVKCLGLDGDKLYCGCSGYSIQEVDLRTHTSSTFYSGAKKLLGKQTIYSVQIRDGLLYTCGSSVDSIAGKIFQISSKAVVGSFSTGLDIQHTAINNDLIFTATKCGIIEVWLRERVTNIAKIRIGSGRTMSIASDADGQKLFVGTSDGKLQIWSLE